MKHVRFIHLIGVFLIISCLSQLMYAQNNGGTFTVGGLVKNKKNGKTIEYVNVSIKGTNVGTITNTDGSFTLTVKKTGQARQLEISSLGFGTVTYPLSEEDIHNQTYYLEPSSVVLKEVQIMNVDPKEVVSQAIHRIKTNYNNQRSLNTAFCRETVQKGRRFIQISEAVAQIIKTPYSDGTVDQDRLRINKGRKLLSPRTDDTLAVKLIGGPTQGVFLDIAKNPNVLLNPYFLAMYNYSFVDYVNIDGKLHYVIEFEPNVESDDIMYEGLLYINTDDYTLTRAEMDMDMSNKDKVTDLILRKKPGGLRFSPGRVSYLINYKESDGFSNLSYIRTEIRFKCDWKRKLFATNYVVVSELVVTDRRDNPDEKILWRESFKSSDILSEKVSDFYDEQFWGDYNIIEPTESLEKAVSKLKKQKQ